MTGTFDRCISTIAVAAIALAALPAAAGTVPRLTRATVAAPRTGAPRSVAVPVTTYHNDFYRSGQYVAANLTFKSAAKLHLDHAFSGPVTGNVYAQPLYWRAPQAATGEVIVATESNHVVALDATTGKVVWDRFLAAPVQGGVLPCGNVSPEGVTGTPVIDPATGSVYVAATVMSSGKVLSLVYALSSKTGHVLAGWPVNVGGSLAAKGFSPYWQGERGALALQGGRLYVPYGGRYGDCDNYHGTVVAISTSHPAVTSEWQTQAVRGGIWSAGGVVLADGNVFASTGNTSGASHWSGGEAVVRLDAALVRSKTSKDFFAPFNWQALDDEDKDLGGSNPMPVDAGGRKLIVALGKDGNAYLIDRTNLGGVGGQLDDELVSTGEIIGGPASWAANGLAFVAFQGSSPAASCAAHNGLTVLRIRGGAKPKVSTAWCAGLNGAGDPIVTTTNGVDNRIVWATGAEGDNRLHGFSAANGAVVYAGGGSGDVMQNLRHMTTILAAQGRIYVASDGRLYAFTP
jgi:outer membrane protein assembly factor BamB